jgi:hypothetical protein
MLASLSVVRTATRFFDDVDLVYIVRRRKYFVHTDLPEKRNIHLFALSALCPWLVAGLDTQWILIRVSPTYVSSHLCHATVGGYVNWISINVEPELVIQGGRFDTVGNRSLAGDEGDTPAMLADAVGSICIVWTVASTQSGVDEVCRSRTRYDEVEVRSVPDLADVIKHGHDFGECLGRPGV